MITEHKSTIRVMACIFFGIAFGALIGSEWRFASVWLVAVIGGVLAGLAGAIAFAFKDIKLWAPVAWRCASVWEWPNWEIWKKLGIDIFSVLCLLCSVSMFTLLLAFIFPQNSEEEFFSLMELYDPAFYLADILMVMVFCPIIYMIVLSVYSDEKTEKTQEDFLLANKAIIKYGNPVIVFGFYPFAGLWYAMKGLIWLAPKIPGCFCLIGRFLKYLAKPIYSDALVLVVLHATIGGAIGAYVGGLWHIMSIGAICAGLGALQYQFISKPYFLKPSLA